MKTKDSRIFDIVFVGLLAAMVYVVTLFRFPLLGSKVHFANAVCLLSGMLLGPTLGGIAAGIGSALYDAFTGYDFVNVVITFVSKFAMAWVCGKLMDVTAKGRHRFDRTLLASIVGALTYVALYMAKTYIYNRFVYGFPLQTVGATVVSKLIPPPSSSTPCCLPSAPAAYSNTFMPERLRRKNDIERSYLIG